MKLLRSAALALGKFSGCMDIIGVRKVTVLERLVSSYPLSADCRSSLVAAETDCMAS